MLEAVINISDATGRLGTSCGGSLLDVHVDRHHNRSVFTLAGPGLAPDVRDLAGAAVQQLDLTRHKGVHPRFGVVDVVPFVPLGPSSMQSALEERNAFAGWLGSELGVPCFLYGPERSLPEVRRRAFVDLVPDTGPKRAHPTAGACAVGARGVLVAYNLWLRDANLAEAKRIASGTRSEHLRTLGFDVGGRAQVSCNLIAPDRLGPAAAYDMVAARAKIDHAELVGLIPISVLEKQPRARWDQLDLSYEKTVEARVRAVLRPGEDPLEAG